MQLSLFCSSIRPHLYQSLFDSLKGNTIDVEFVFAGNVKDIPAIDLPEHVHFKYIKTADIKPAQAYEVARRECCGELIGWIADDAIFPDDVLGKAYRAWKERCSFKDVLCIRTKENYNGWRDCDESCHHFFANTPESPKMAPIGMMNREYLNRLGGIDRRFESGQWDNEILMRLYNDGGHLVYFGDAFVLLDHSGKHENYGDISFKRPFGKGYSHDRDILEGAWGRKGQMKYSVPYRRFDKGFEPFEETDLLTKTQGYAGGWE